ncbi:hypothetical protein VA7868_04204 [Vibrio aerogenes CECT 7868]|uniref:Uncharacterized protein n=1 Tax=Vibrio aerogenes CECT 7868 TaxID=1216006 RepID=A0A1M6DE14_9VIBR|nr:hypothetical protein [Vibrio aerogenes]SHI71452.1 hypothetical protein VA7868_04204 [Vibrio aerogenes CECT 7868]
MKKLFVLLSTLILSVSVTAFADDVQTEESETWETTESEVLPEAPREVISDALDSCSSWAKDDGIGEDDLAPYLLNCVNGILNEQGYLSVSSIDQ